MKSVLLVDDAALMRNLLKRILVQKGYEICGEASNGEEAIEQYRLRKPDLVFLDISMPVMDGMECLQNILLIDPDAKVIMCTSQGKENFADEAISIGAKHYVVKPLNQEEVYCVTERVLAGGSINYKDVMMEMTVNAGMSQRETLEFFDAFRALTGDDMDALFVDKIYLKANKEKVGIGVEAFLASKLSLEKIDKLVEIYNKICE